MSWGAIELLWLLLLAPLAALAAAALWRRRLGWVRAWASAALWSRLRLDFDRQLLRLSVIALGLVVAGLGLALAQPRWGDVEESVERQGVDIVFVIDSSLSMAAADLPPSRLAVARQVVRRLVQELPGNRVALVQVEGDGVVLAPLTVDAAVIDLVLETVDSGTLPTPGTHIAKSLQLAVELFPEGTQKHRVIVVLSDGEDHVGGLDEITKELTEAGVTLHALGVGTPQGAPLPIPGSGGDYKKDRKGQVVISRLDEDALRHLAEATDGFYAAVTGIGTSLDGLVGEIEAMEKRRIGGETVVSQEERFQWALLLAALAMAIFLLCDPLAPTVEEAA